MLRQSLLGPKLRCVSNHEHRRIKGSPFSRGFLTNLLNPKIALFYSAFLPQFSLPSTPVFLTSVLLGSILNLMELFWLSSYGYFVTKMGYVLQRPKIKKGLDSTIGVVLIILGLRIAFAL